MTCSISLDAALNAFEKSCPNETPVAYWKDPSGYIFEVKLPKRKVYRSPLYRINNNGQVTGTRPDLENIRNQDRILIRGR